MIPAQRLLTVSVVVLLALCGCMRAERGASVAPPSGNADTARSTQPPRPAANDAGTDGGTAQPGASADEVAGGLRGHLAFSKDGRRLAFASLWNADVPALGPASIRVFNTAHPEAPPQEVGRCLAPWVAWNDRGDGLYALQSGKDGATLVELGLDGKVRARSSTFAAQRDDWQASVGYNAEMGKAACLRPRGPQRSLLVWSVKSGALKRVALPTDLALDARSPVMVGALGRVLMVPSDRAGVAAWDMGTGEWYYARPTARTGNQWHWTAWEKQPPPVKPRALPTDMSDDPTFYSISPQGESLFLLEPDRVRWDVPPEAFLPPDALLWCFYPAPTPPLSSDEKPGVHMDYIGPIAADRSYNSICVLYRRPEVAWGQCAEYRPRGPNRREAWDEKWVVPQSTAVSVQAGLAVSGDGRYVAVCRMLESGKTVVTVTELQGGKIVADWEAHAA